MYEDHLPCWQVLGSSLLSGQSRYPSHQRDMSTHRPDKLQRNSCAAHSTTHNGRQTCVTCNGPAQLLLVILMHIRVGLRVIKAYTRENIFKRCRLFRLTVTLFPRAYEDFLKYWVLLLISNWWQKLWWQNCTNGVCRFDMIDMSRPMTIYETSEKLSA